MKKLIIDLDNTICHTAGSDYAASEPVAEIVNRMIMYKKEGFIIVINTSRNMRTYDGDLEKINAYTLPTIIKWLDRHNIPYDEIIVGKPWCGLDGFYVDDRAIRPSEFLKYEYADLIDLIEKE